MHISYSFDLVVQLFPAERENWQREEAEQIAGHRSRFAASLYERDIRDMGFGLKRPGIDRSSGDSEVAYFTVA